MVIPRSPPSLTTPKAFELGWNEENKDEDYRYAVIRPFCIAW